MLSDDEFRLLLDAMDRPWSGFRKVRKGVKKRLRRHMTTIGCRSIQDYLERIDHDPAIRSDCEQCLTVTISRFHRDRRLWEYLYEAILPALSLRFPDGLYAWSAGCANGEEPYSLSLLWESLYAANASLPPLVILATDNQETCLNNARLGIYPLSSLKEVPEPLLQKWFHKVPGRKMWQISDQPARRIRWQYHQLLDTPPQGLFHLILLRNNLLTYYRGRTMTKALAAIAQRLTSDGVLIVGSHEHLPDSAVGLSRDIECPWVYHRVR